MRPISPTKIEPAVLTGNLLLYRFKSGKFQIRFVDPNDPDLLLLAGEMLKAFASAADRKISRLQLEEELELFRKQYEIKTADGLIKLLMDRTAFSQNADLDYPRLRARVFESAFEQLTQCRGDWKCFRRNLKPVCGEIKDIYGDLPGFEQILHFDPLKAEELICRYNLALAQGMFFFADTLLVRVTDPDPAQLRRMFKYLKFFRLLARIIEINGSSASFEISGPFSIFGTTRKYALNLAVFFPAVVRLQKWSISAQLEVNGRKGKLLLDHSCGLVSHYRNFSAYVPEEIKMFHRLFAEKVSSWKIVGDTPVLTPGGQEFVIPDISFEAENGAVCHLELFHRWHRTQLEQRLQTLKKTTLPLIVGIDRALMENDEFEALLQNNPALKNRIFRFSDFPGVETVSRLLKKFLPL